MKRSDLIFQLNNIYIKLDTLPSDSSLIDASRNIQNIADNLGSIIQEIEYDGIEVEEKEVEEKEVEEKEKQ